MRQIGNEDDPLKRIQDEINEVARRERELREKTQRQQQQLKIQQQQQQQQQILQNNNEHNNINSTNNVQHFNNHIATNGTLNNSNSNNISLNSTLSLNDESSSTNTSISPIITNNKDSNLDTEHHSDDSGISASSSPIPRNVKKYIRTNNYNVISPTPPPQMLLNKPIIKSSSNNNNNNNNNNVSSNNINNIGTSITQNGNITQRPSLIHFTPIRRVTTGPAHKGLMQRFIATRGKISIHGSINGLNGIHATNGVNGIMKDGPISPIDQFHQTHRNSVFLQQVNNPTTPPIIERDTEGKPLRPGYIPVEEKIQKELKDLKNRESELKKIRKLKLRQSQPDLLESIENEFAESDEDSEVEHCYPPGKLRAVKSISELCDSMNSSSLSPSRTTPSPNFERSRHQSENLRPAVSLAQLCELDNDEEAPSSHELIAKWESLIQQNA